ncbi:MAG TPA: exopolysaccharide biosynthesis polyprenyl glycosylphosphotransferase [Candidatus Acidoferrum sp.]|nr:exopolysaccharide biosynthesis polyprenyl glycosylphosphotransferase [Candidatus Acidoferrum sp.]
MLLRLKLYRLLIKLAVYPLPFAAFYLGLALWSFSWSLVERPADFSAYSRFTVPLLACFVWAFFAEHYKVTSVDELFRERTGAKAVVAACFATSVVLLASLYFSRNAEFPRGFFVFNVAVLLVLAVILRALFRALLRSQFGYASPTRLLVIGTDRFARDAATRLQRLSFAPCRVAAFVHLPGQEVAVENGRVYELDELCASGATESVMQGVDEAVIALQSEQFCLIPGILRCLNHLCLPARALVDLGEGVVVRERLFQLGRMQMLDLTQTPADFLDYALLKRLFDAAFSAAVLLIASPLLLLIAVLIRLTSRGPVFFKQERIGLNGRPFSMYKFRTMRFAAASESDTRWTTANDPRCTPLGAFLRQTSLDELPQFFNVLKGDMSVVGPRPERPHFVHRFHHEVGRYNNRHCLRVGITGWAQVNGWRGDTSIDKRIEYDLYYLQNWSFLFDLRIIAMTILSGLIHRNAY